MKIVYCSTPPFADCDLPLIRAFCKAGHKVDYFLHIAPYSRKSTYVEIEKLKDEWGILPVSAYPELERLAQSIPGVSVHIVNNPAGKNNLQALLLSIKERRMISRLNPDVVHYVESPAPFHLPMLWRNRSRAVCVIHDPVPHLNRMKRMEFVCRRLASMMLNKFILLSNRQTDEFCRQFGVSPGKVYFSALGPYEMPETFRGENRNPYGKYILMFGRITPYKGIDKGIALIDRISKDFKDVSLVIAGSGDLYFDSSLVEGKPYIRLIHRYIPVEEQYDLVSNAQFVLCPYTEATQSGVVQTALGLGVPAVVTDVGALSDAVTDGKNGLVVPPQNTTALEQAVRTLLEKPETLARMREYIQNDNTSGEHSWTRIAEKYIEIYHA